MKRTSLKLPLAAVVGGLAISSHAQAQWVVTDPGLLAQTTINTVIAEQTLLSSRVIEQNTGDIARRIGDAATVGQVAGAANVLQALPPSTTALSQTAVPWTGKGALTYDGGKLYLSIGESMTAPDGTTVNRNADAYKKFEAAHQTAANYLTVLRETEARRQAVLEGIRATTEAAQTAPDLATVQKLVIASSGQIATLNAIDGERMAALGGVLVQSFDNSTDDARQEQARREDRSLDLHHASTQLAKFLTPLAARASSKSVSALKTR